MDLHQPPKPLYSGVLLPINPAPYFTPIQNTQTISKAEKPSVLSGELLLTGHQQQQKSAPFRGALRRVFPGRYF
jgi:hypothetical protein